MCAIGNQTVCRETFVIVAKHLGVSGVPNAVLRQHIEANDGCLAARKNAGHRLIWKVDKEAAIAVA